MSEVPPKPSLQRGTTIHAHDFWKTARRHPLEAIFRPNTVAVVGASDREGSVGRTILWNIISSPFGGTVYPVNYKRKNVLGIRAYRTILDVPDPVELAVIVVPAKTVPSVMKDCAKSGVQGAIIISAGFKEVGPEGVLLEQEVLSIARAGGIRVVGPNCLGVMSPLTGLNATFAKKMARPGGVALISQSGAICTAILDWSLKESLGFSAFLSLGSMLDVGWGDLIFHLGDDPYTKAIVLYMETIGDARAFMSAAREVAQTKPIIVIKPGKTEAAAKAAASHTGSMTGSDAVLDAAFRRCGVLRVERISDLFKMAELIGKQPRPNGPNLTIITNAGGPGVISTDALLGSGGKLAPLGDKVKEELNCILPKHWSHANPIDILGDASPETYAATVKAVTQDPDSNGVLVILSPQAMTDPTHAADLLAKTSQDLSKSRKPLLASWMGGDDVSAGTSILSQAGVPTYDFPDTAARLFSYLWKYAANLRELYETPKWGAEMHPKRDRVTEVIEKVRKTGRIVLTEWESKQLLNAYGIPTVKTVLASSAEEASNIADEIGYPVVIKINSETITHKTDVGGVHLNILSPEGVKDAYHAIEQAVLEHYSKEDFLGVTVQPMVDLSEAYELILGSSPDSQFGPVILFGSGGTLVEVYKDRALGLPPLNSVLARNLMRGTKIYEALKGVRGRLPVNMDALETLMVNFSHLVIEQPWIKEIDINPLLASEKSLIALDARVLLHDSNIEENDLIKPAIRPYPSQYEQTWKTKKGMIVEFRPVMPEDEPMMVKFHQKLSDESIHLRFMSNINCSERIQHDRLVRVCHVDYDQDMAIVVVHELMDGTKEIVGAGRLGKMHGVNSAEFSMIVADKYQRQGIGTKMLCELVRIGKDEKLDYIEAVILPINHGMLKVSKKVGFQTKLDEDEEVFRAYMPLTERVTNAAQ